MSGAGDPSRPTPRMMPRRRPEVPAAQRAPSRAVFQVAAGAPRRGWPGAIVWPDTGILLALGTRQILLDLFRAHYGGRVRITRRVTREIHGWASRPVDAATPAGERALVEAAIRARDFLGGSGIWPVVEPAMADLPEVNTVRDQLAALPGGAGKRHGGEAEIIVLAAHAAAADGQKHVLLANDGGASVVAYRHADLVSRHIGNILAEFACAGLGPTPDQWYDICETAMSVSAPPVRCRPQDAKAFTCQKGESGCTACDHASGR